MANFANVECLQILYKESSKADGESKTAAKEELVNGLDDDSDMVVSDEDESLSDVTEGNGPTKVCRKNGLSQK